MTSGARSNRLHNLETMANAVVKLQATLTELGRQVTASVDALHTIRARTSKVLLATAAFGALAVEVDVLRRRLASTAVAAELLRDDDDRATFHAELHRLIDQLESYRLVYAAELSLATARRARPRARWWQWGQVFIRRTRAL